MTKTKAIYFIIFIVITLLPIKVFATETHTTNPSKYEVSYSDELTTDTKSGCEVEISIPYQFSDTIPKEIEPEESEEQEDKKPTILNVQTGDTTNIALYLILSITALCGIVYLMVSNKKQNRLY